MFVRWRRRKQFLHTFNWNKLNSNIHLFLLGNHFLWFYTVLLTKEENRKKQLITRKLTISFLLFFFQLNRSAALETYLTAQSQAEEENKNGIAELVWPTYSARTHAHTHTDSESLKQCYHFSFVRTSFQWHNVAYTPHSFTLMRMKRIFCRIVFFFLFFSLCDFAIARVYLFLNNLKTVSPDRIGLG